MPHAVAAAGRRVPMRNAGFTLIELVVTLGLLGVMAMLAAPMAELALQRAKEQELRLALREIRGAIDRYRRAADHGQVARRVGDSGYPPSLDVLVQGVPNLHDPNGGRVYFLRRLPRDPFAPEGAGARWGVRSYASPPDDPQEGDDVFDVHSRSTAVGLDGVPYREW